MTTTQKRKLAGGEIPWALGLDARVSTTTHSSIHPFINHPPASRLNLVFAPPTPGRKPPSLLQLASLGTSSQTRQWPWPREGARSERSRPMFSLNLQPNCPPPPVGPSRRPRHPNSCIPSSSKIAHSPQQLPTSLPVLTMSTATRAASQARENGLGRASLLLQKATAVLSRDPSQASRITFLLRFSEDLDPTAMSPNPPIRAISRRHKLLQKFTRGGAVERDSACLDLP